MATKNMTVKHAHVNFYEAYDSSSDKMHGTLIKNMLSPLKQQVIEFTTLDDLKCKVNEIGFTLSYERGHGIAAGVSMARGERKPPGFDEFSQLYNFEYNLTPEPKEEPPKPTPQQQAEQIARDAARAERAKDPVEYIDAADTAKLLRAQLTKHFPGVTFSVKTHKYAGGASIDVNYTDGPTLKDVERVTHQFQGSGFDGMIDMAFNYDHWLMPDGSSQVAYTPGTSGSMGVYESIDNKKPHPDAKRVSFMADHVFVNREYSEAVFNEKVKEIGKRYGVTVENFDSTEFIELERRLNRDPRVVVRIELAEQNL